MEKRHIIVKDEKSRAHALRVMRTLPVSRPVLLTFEDYHERRSNNQNARLWALHTLAARVAGCSPQEMHEECLRQYFGWTEKKIGEFAIRITNERSSKLTKERFREFMDWVEGLYIEQLGVFLP